MAHPKSPNGYRIGIINPLTLIGTEIQTILRERGFPFNRVTLLDSSGQSAGALTEVDDEPAIVTPISAEELEDLDLVFFCGGAEGNRDWVARHEQDGFIAIDLSQPTTAEDGVLAVANANLDEVEDGSLFVSPHPAALPIALILRQVATVAPVDFCAATVVQPASHFEQQGVEELAQQAIHVLNVQPIPKSVFERQLAFNLYPAAERHDELIAGQVRALTRADVALFVTQGTLFHGHTFSLFVRTKEEVEVDRVVAALRANKALDFAEGDQQLGTIDAAGRDEVLIAEVREDRGGFWVWAVCDNLRRGSALNAVLIAEKVLFGASRAN